MPLFEIDWKSQGTAVVEADDADEAEQLLTEALENFETVQLEEVEVEDVTITDNTLKHQDD